MSDAAPTTVERFRRWLVEGSVQRRLAMALIAAAMVSVLATVAAMTGWSSDITEVRTILYLVYLNCALLLLLGLVVARRLVTVWREQRHGKAGAGLHVRMVVLFGLIAVTPAILVSVFSALFINYGLDVSFSKQINTAVSQSGIVANAYLKEHRKNISTDAYAIAGDLNFNAPLMTGDLRQFNGILSHHAALRSLSEALVIDRDGRVMARSQLSLSVKVGQIPDDAFDRADRGEITVLGGRKEQRMRVLMRLASVGSAYLLVERFIDPQVIDHINRIEQARSRYQALERERSGIQISFVMIFIVVAVLLLLAAIWVALVVSTQLAKPISSLISAAEQVTAGDLSARVETTDSTDEISILSRTFNNMTSQLKNTQEGLMDANRELDERRRFTETVLAGVSAGVIGLDKDGRVHLPNRSASELLATDLENAVGRPLADAVPEMAELVGTVMKRPRRPRQAEITIAREGRFRTLVVSVAAESLGGEVIGYVVTFDDVTELFSAQRMAAWADVARRIAHEIKNPLTPIQLSAERLKRKYMDEIKSDPETFASCTDTIVRQVEDLHRMVDEFSAFARMPQLSLNDENLSEICRETVMLERNRHPDIDYEADLPEDDVRLYCDQRQVSRALTNLMKNAAESVMSARAGTEGAAERGSVRVSLSGRHGDTVGDDAVAKSNIITVTVEDNGLGLPNEQRENLTEPYVTTRTKGTGLGLAIVKKIMEDHNGDVLLKDRDGGGARVSLVFRPLERVTDAERDAGGEVDPMNVATGLLARGS